MKCVLFKASDWQFIDLIEVNSISELVHEFGEVIVNYNHHHKEPEAFMEFYGLDEEMAKQAAEIEFEVMIYDDYIE